MREESPLAILGFRGLMMEVMWMEKLEVGRYWLLVRG